MADFGKFRHRFSILRDTFTQDSFNEMIPTETTVATRWGRVKALTGTELTQADQVQGQITHEVETWADASLNLTVKDRLGFAGLKLNIEAIIPDESNSEWLIKCKAVTP